MLGSARERAREADLLRLGLEEIEAVDPQPGEEESLATEESRLGFADTLRTAAETAREALSSENDAPDALGAVAAARRALESVREHDPEVAALADRVAEVSYLLADVAADVASYSTGVETDPATAGRGVRAAGGADRPDQEVRRERGRGPRVVAGLRRAAAQPRRLRRADRGAARRAGASCASTLAHDAAELSALRAEAGERLSSTRHRASCTRCRCRRPGSSYVSAGSEDDGGPRDRRRTLAVHALAASTRSSCSWPPTPAPSRGRSTRARPGASSPG